MYAVRRNICLILTGVNIFLLAYIYLSFKTGNGRRGDHDFQRPYHDDKNGRNDHSSRNSDDDYDYTYSDSTEIDMNMNNGPALQALLSSTSSDLLNHEPPIYLKNFRNPCFKVPYWILEKVGNVTNNFHSRISPDELSTFCLPTYFHVGVAKTGTSDIHDRLTSHQDVYQSYLKEPCFLSSKTDIPHYPTFQKTNWTYTLLNYIVLLKASSLYYNEFEEYNYAGRFNYSSVADNSWSSSDFGKYKLLLDSTPFYAASLIQRVPKKIQEFIPDPRILFSVRDPVERMLSEIKDVLRQHKEIWEPIERKYKSSMGEYLHKRVVDTVKDYRKCILKHSQVTCTHSYTDVYPYKYKSLEYFLSRAFRHSIYHFQLKKYVYRFEEENLLVIDMHEYAKNPTKFVDKIILPFLGLRPYNPIIKKGWKKRKEPVNKNTEIELEFLPKTKFMLAVQFKESLQQLSKILFGREFSWYKTPFWKNILERNCTYGNEIYL